MADGAAGLTIIDIAVKTITLTLDRYTHLHSGDEVRALASLPDLGPTAETASATAGAS